MNFKDNAFVESVSSAMMAKHLYVGSKVVVIKRISTTFTDGPYADITTTNFGFIKGESDGEPVVNFQKLINGKVYKADVKVKVDNLELYKEGSNDTPAASSGGSRSAAPTAAAKLKLDTKFEFLANDSTTSLTIVGAWAKQMATDHEDTKLKLLNGCVGFSLKNVLDVLPRYTDKDLVVCIRDQEVEVWTVRDFEKGALVFGPETNEYKNRNWCQTRSALVKFDTGQPSQFTCLECV